jgi:hypothetical protein
LQISATRTALNSGQDPNGSAKRVCGWRVKHVSLQYREAKKKIMPENYRRRGDIPFHIFSIRTVHESRPLCSKELAPLLFWILNAFPCDFFFTVQCRDGLIVGMLGGKGVVADRRSETPYFEIQIRFRISGGL